MPNNPITENGLVELFQVKMPLYIMHKDGVYRDI